MRARLAAAKLAVHDAMWRPGTAGRPGLPVIAEMLDAAQASGDDDLVAQGATCFAPRPLLEGGDPAGRDELLTYVTLGREAGSRPAGRWGALTRQATFAQIAGRAEEGRAAGASRRWTSVWRSARQDAHGLLLHLPLVARGPRRA